MTLVPSMAAVPPTAPLTAMIVRLWPLSLAEPTLSLPSRSAKAMVRAAESSSTAPRVSPVATGASFTSVTVQLTVAVEVLKSATPLVVPLSCTV